MDSLQAGRWVPASCTLPAVDQPLRLAEFDAMFQVALRSIHRPDATRLVLDLAPAPDRSRQVRDLTDRESACCSFFTFTVAEHDDRLLVEVAVPPDHVAVLDGIAERAARHSH